MARLVAGLQMTQQPRERFDDALGLDPQRHVLAMAIAIDAEGAAGRDAGREELDVLESLLAELPYARQMLLGEGDRIETAHVAGVGLGEDHRDGLLLPW